MKVNPVGVQHGQVAVIGHYVNAGLDGFGFVSFMTVLIPGHSLAALGVVRRCLDRKVHVVLPKFVHDGVVVL